MPPRSPNSTHPIRTREAVRERHIKILELWQEDGRADGARTPREIAELVGLKHASNIYWHIDGRCKCLS